MSPDGECRFSPLAEAQLDALWDYGYRRFGEVQADEYLDGLFSAITAVAATDNPSASAVRRRSHFSDSLRFISCRIKSRKYSLGVS